MGGMRVIGADDVKTAGARRFHGVEMIFGVDQIPGGGLIKVVGAELRMLPLEKGVFLEVGMAVELKPRGYHLFFQGLTQPLVRGQKVPVTLTFAKAGTRETELVVEAEGYINRDALGLAQST